MINQNDKAKFKKDFIKRLINLGLDGIKLCRELKKPLLKKTIEVSRIIGSSILTLKGKK